MRALWEGRRYTSAMVGLALILALVGLAIYGVIAIPYNEALRLWRGGEGIWIEFPRNAQPEWINLFPGKNLPKTMALDSREGDTKQAQPWSDGLKSVRISLGFDYPRPDEEEMKARWAKVEELLQDDGYDNENGPGIIDIESL